MAKGLGLAGFTLLGILGIAARGACEERTAPAQASAFLEKRMAEAVARGGEKEQRRVLLDDLAAWTDGRYSVPIDGSCFVKILISEKSEEVAQEALPLLHIFLVRGNPDNPDFKRPADSYSLLFKRASEGWLRLATKGFTDEERALYALGCFSDPKAPPLKPEAIAKRIKASPTPAVRAKVFEYLENDKRSKQEGTLDLWAIQEMNDLLFEDGYFKATEEELLKLLRGRAFMGRRVAFEVLNRLASNALVPFVLGWLRNGDQMETVLARWALYAFVARRGHDDVLAIAFDKLKSCPFDMTRPEQVKERAGWLQVVSWCEKDPRSIELFTQEKKALAQVNLLRQKEPAKELWMAFYYRKRLLEKTLAKWEKK